jgi:hypothetical protein
MYGSQQPRHLWAWKHVTHLEVARAQRVSSCGERYRLLSWESTSTYSRSRRIVAATPSPAASGAGYLVERKLCGALQCMLIGVQVRMLPAIWCCIQAHGGIRLRMHTAFPASGLLLLSPVALPAVYSSTELATV